MENSPHIRDLYKKVTFRELIPRINSKYTCLLNTCLSNHTIEEFINAIGHEKSNIAVILEPKYRLLGLLLYNELNMTCVFDPTLEIHKIIYDIWLDGLRSSSSTDNNNVPYKKRKFEETVPKPSDDNLLDDLDEYGSFHRDNLFGGDPLFYQM